MVESQPSKLLVAGPIPVSRSKSNHPGARSRAGAFELSSTPIPVRSTRSLSNSSIGNFDQPVLRHRRSCRILCGSQRHVEAVFFLQPSSPHSLSRSSAQRHSHPSTSKPRSQGSCLATPPKARSTSKLGNADQGQIREFYLASTRARRRPSCARKFFKLYAYY